MRRAREILARWIITVGAAWAALWLPGEEEFEECGVRRGRSDGSDDEWPDTGCTS